MTALEREPARYARRVELLELYRIAIEEYRFEVRLNWDRTSYLLTLNSVILGAAAGLIQWQDTGGPSRAASVLVVVVGLIGIFAAWLGLETQSKGKEYYDRTILKKTLLEGDLGLLAPRPGFGTANANRSVVTTHGMREVAAMLSDPDAWLGQKRFRLFRRTIVAYTGWLFVAFVVLDAGLIVVALSGRSP